MRTWAAVAVCLLAAGAGAVAPGGTRKRPRPQPRVIGGEPVEDMEQVPWQVVVYAKHHKDVRGSGSIISHKWVLTSATLFRYCSNSDGNCRDLTADDIAVRAGSTHWNTNGTVYEAERLEQYEALAGLIKVQGWFSMGVHIKPIFPSTSLPAAGTNMAVCGWGEYEPYTYPFDLRCKNVTMLDQPSCEKAYSQYPIYMMNFMFCTLSEGRGPSKGDVGSPLVANKTQYGIFHTTGSTEDEYYPELYVSLPPLTSWIFHQAGI